MVTSTKRATGTLVNKNEKTAGSGIRRPRPLWMDFVLHFGTIGFYSCFWMFASARELRALTGRPLIPWLWFFVPLVAPAQLVAIPRFIRAWDAVGQPYGLDKWSKWTVPVTLAMVSLWIVSYAPEAFPDTFEVFLGWFLVWLMGWLLCWAGLFCGMTARVNRVKRSLPEDRFAPARRGYTVLEWILLACLSALMLIVIASWAFDRLAYDDLEELPAGSDYVDARGIYTFPIVGDGWRRVEIGKHSDGSAAVEIEVTGTLMMYFLVFEHARNTSISEVVSMRMDESRDNAGGTCKESRTFVRDRPIVVSYTECKGRFFLDPSLDTVTVFDVDGQVYELYGWLNPPSESFERLAVDFRQMARGFEPL